MTRVRRGLPRSDAGFGDRRDSLRDEEFAPEYEEESKQKGFEPLGNQATEVFNRYARKVVQGWSGNPAVKVEAASRGNQFYSSNATGVPTITIPRFDDPSTFAGTDEVSRFRLFRQGSWHESGHVKYSPYAWDYLAREQTRGDLQRKQMLVNFIEDRRLTDHGLEQWRGMESEQKFVEEFARKMRPAVTLAEVKSKVGTGRTEAVLQKHLMGGVKAKNEGELSAIDAEIAPIDAALVETERQIDEAQTETAKQTALSKGINRILPMLGTGTTGQFNAPSGEAFTIDYTKDPHAQTEAISEQAAKAAKRGRQEVEDALEKDKKEKRKKMDEGKKKLKKIKDAKKDLDDAESSGKGKEKAKEKLKKALKDADPNATDDEVDEEADRAEKEARSEPKSNGEESEGGEEEEGGEGGGEEGSSEGEEGEEGGEGSGEGEGGEKGDGKTGSESDKTESEPKDDKGGQSTEGQGPGAGAGDFGTPEQPERQDDIESRLEKEVKRLSEEHREAKEIADGNEQARDDYDDFVFQSSKPSIEVTEYYNSTPSFAPRYIDKRMVSDIEEEFSQFTHAFSKEESRRGGTVSVGRYVAGSKTPFDRRLMNSPQRNIMFLLDGSGSTGSIMPYYKRGVMSTAEALERLGVDFSVYGFTGSGEYSFKTEDQPWNSQSKGRLAAFGSSGGTPLAEAYDTLEGRVRKQAPDVVVTVTDGAPDSETSAMAEIKAIKKRYGVKMVGVYIGDEGGRRLLQRLGYDDAFAVDPSEMPKKFPRLIVEMLAGG